MLWYQSSGAYLHYTNINRGVHPLALKCPKVRRCRRCGAKHAARLATLVSRLPLHRAHRRTCVEQNSQVPPVFPGRIWHRCWFCHEVSILVWQPTRINCGCGCVRNKLGAVILALLREPLTLCQIKPHPQPRLPTFFGGGSTARSASSPRASRTD